MKPRIEILQEKKLVGKSTRMSLVENKTGRLWQSFMTRKTVLKSTLGDDLYSLQVYDSTAYFQNFNPQAEFTKWACIEVDNFKNIPNGFGAFTLDSGLYAIFLHHGPSIEFPKTAQFIYGQWLPNSDYVLDERPHFEILGAKYKNDAADSEEEVWIPIMKKA